MELEIVNMNVNIISVIFTFFLKRDLRIYQNENKCEEMTISDYHSNLSKHSQYLFDSITNKCKNNTVLFVFNIAQWQK